MAVSHIFPLIFPILISHPKIFGQYYLHFSNRTRMNSNILRRSVGILWVNIDALHFVSSTVWKYFSQFIGTCNGVVLLYNGISEINPAIHRFLDLIGPLEIPKGYNGNYEYNLRFGYDNVNCDHKLNINDNTLQHKPH